MYATLHTCRIKLGVRAYGYEKSELMSSCRCPELVLHRQEIPGSSKHSSSPCTARTNSATTPHNQKAIPTFDPHTCRASHRVGGGLHMEPVVRLRVNFSVQVPCHIHIYMFDSLQVHVSISADNNQQQQFIIFFKNICVLCRHYPGLPYWMLYTS